MEPAGSDRVMGQRYRGHRHALRRRARSCSRRAPGDGPDAVQAFAIVNRAAVAIGPAGGTSRPGHRALAVGGRRRSQCRDRQVSGVCHHGGLCAVERHCAADRDSLALSPRPPGRTMAACCASSSASRSKRPTRRSPDPASPSSTAPFAITRWEAGRRAVYTADENAPGGRPFLDSRGRPDGAPDARPRDRAGPRRYRRARARRAAARARRASGSGPARRCG